MMTLMPQRSKASNQKPPAIHDLDIRSIPKKPPAASLCSQANRGKTHQQG
jgi:hypothetical protein